MPSCLTEANAYDCVHYILSTQAYLLFTWPTDYGLPTTGYYDAGVPVVRVTDSPVCWSINVQYPKVESQIAKQVV